MLNQAKNASDDYNDIDTKLQASDPTVAQRFQILAGMIQSMLHILCDKSPPHPCPVGTELRPVLAPPRFQGTKAANITDRKNGNVLEAQYICRADPNPLRTQGCIVTVVGYDWA